jgi:hypothetical protein
MRTGRLSLAVAFCRCMNIPARYCTGYLGLAVLVTEPEIPRLTGRHEAHRTARAATLELIAHAWNLVLHSLHCTDKYSCRPVQPVAAPEPCPARLAIPALPKRWSV